MAESTIRLEPATTQASFARRLRASSTALLFLLPAAVLVLVFFVAPVIITLWVSMTDMSTSTFSNPSFIGLENYSRMFRSAGLTKIIGNTVFYVGVTLALFNIGMALAIALLTTHIPRRAARCFARYGCCRASRRRWSIS